MFVMMVEKMAQAFCLLCESEFLTLTAFASGA